MGTRKQTLAGAAFLSLLALGSNADAASCATASLADYAELGAGGCSVGALTFSSFVVEAFPGPSAQQIAPTSVSLSPLANGLALSGAGALNANTSELLGLRFLFTVSLPSLGGATVALGADRTVGGDGVITALLDAGAAGNAIAISIDGFSDTPVSFVSAPLANYAAFLEFGIDGGTVGSAGIGPQLASLTFAASNPIPEPGTAALLPLGLACLIAFARRRSIAA
jgi:hypothetical protein